MSDRFEGFSAHDVPVGDGATIHVRAGGDGPPALLLHGYPETHLMWHAVAPVLAARGHRVVVADLPGYGASTPPRVTDDHVPSSKRATADALRAVMAALGHERFAVLGHDRGARVAYRLALDMPEVVTRLAVLDVVPTLDVWEQADDRLSMAYWHWGFLAQPAPLPESLIGSDPQAFFDHHVRRMGIGGVAGRYPDDVLAAYRAQLDAPATVATICEDYRAGATVDRALDDADRAAGRTIAIPTLALWGARGALPLLYDDVLAIWRRWAPAAEGGPVEAGHFLAEDAPEEVADRLGAFLDAGRAVA